MNAFYFPSMSRYFPGHKKDKKLIRLRAAAGTKKWILMNKICFSKSLDVADVTIFLKIFNNWRSNLSNDDMISAYSLKTCLQNDIFLVWNSQPRFSLSGFGGGAGKGPFPTPPPEPGKSA